LLETLKTRKLLREKFPLLKDRLAVLVDML